MDDREKKSGRRWFVMLILALALVLVGSGLWTGAKQDVQPKVGQIYLYGESHGVEVYLDKEFELWSQHYHQDGMRHLFVEYPYYTAELLNLWMAAEDDEILNQVFWAWSGTAAGVQEELNFLKRIKAECPETVFHGTDVGHQYQTTGIQYLNYLEENGLEATEQYLRTQEVIIQGVRYYGNNEKDHVYRENQMAKNFLEEYAALDGADVMGIYGSAHVSLIALDYYTKTVPCMTSQLEDVYGENLHIENIEKLVEFTPATLSQLELPAPGETGAFELKGEEYQAECLGWQDLTTLENSNYLACIFWRLEEGAYEAAQDCPVTNNVLTYSNFPVPVEEGQVFVVDYILRYTGGTQRTYLRTDGNFWSGQVVAEGFLPI